MSPVLNVKQVRVMNLSIVGGSALRSAPTPFEVRPAMYIERIHPTLGPISGDTLITVYGGNFSVEDNALVCRFGDSEVEAFILSDSSVACQSPAVSLVGRVSLHVGLPSRSLSEAGQDFLYYASPQVFNMRPSLLSVHGGESVTVIGQSFVPLKTLAVSFGGHTKVNATFLSSTMVSLVTPPQEGGETMLEISANGVDWAKTTVKARFTIPFSVTQVLPSAGPHKGGSFVTVFGSNFSSTSSFVCNFGKVSVIPLRRQDNTVVCVSPRLSESHAAGDVLPFHLHSTEQPGWPQSFDYAVLAQTHVHRLEPSSGSSLGGTFVDVFGDGFYTGSEAVCLFGDVSVAAEVFSTSWVQCVAPSHLETAVPLEISCNSGADFTFDNILYCFVEPLVVRAVIPSTGPVLGGGMVTLVGTNFRVSQEFVALFGQASPSTCSSFYSSSLMRVCLPSRAEGQVMIQVTHAHF